MLLHTVQTLAFLIQHTVRSYVSTIVGLHDKKQQQQQQKKYKYQPIPSIWAT